MSLLKEDEPPKPYRASVTKAMYKPNHILSNNWCLSLVLCIRLNTIYNCFVAEGINISIGSHKATKRKAKKNAKKGADVTPPQKKTPAKKPKSSSKAAKPYSGRTSWSLIVVLFHAWVLHTSSLVVFRWVCQCVCRVCLRIMHRVEFV